MLKNQETEEEGGRRLNTQKLLFQYTFDGLVFKNTYLHNQANAFSKHLPNRNFLLAPSDGASGFDERCSFLQSKKKRRHLGLENFSNANSDPPKNSLNSDPSSLSPIPYSPLLVRM